MKILVVENLNHGEQPWWLPYLPEAFDRNDMDIAEIPESTGGRWSVLWQLLKLYPKLNRYDILLTYQDSYATFLFSLLSRVLPFKSYRHVVHEFITSPKSASRYSKIKYSFIKFCFGAVDLINCSSNDEITYYQKQLALPDFKMCFVPLTTNPDFLRLESSTDSDFIIAAGRTGRDYDTLMEAVRGTQIKLYLVAGQHNVESLSIPENVKLLVDIPMDELMDLMSRARLVVTPLYDYPISIGQSVVLQAMALGKGMVVSRVSALKEYVEHQATGYMVEPGDAVAMRHAIEYLLDHPEEAGRMGANAKEAVTKRFLPTVGMQVICDKLRTLTQNRP